MTDTTMDQVHKKTVVASAGSLLSALDAIRNFRALLLLGLTFLVAGAVGALFVMIGAKAGSGLLSSFGVLLAWLVLFYGSSAVGIMLMRQVQGYEKMSLMDAVLLSLFTSHRLLAVVLLEGLIFIAALIVLAIVFFICKIPGIGPFLYTFVFPLSAILMGVLTFALVWIMLPLAGPAVWAGHSVFQVIARLTALARQKLVLVVMLEFVLAMITGFAAFIIFSIVTIGASISSGLSAGILGSEVSGGFGSLMGGFGALAYGGGSGYLTAAMLGGGLLFAVAMVIPGLIFTMGTCIIFIDTTQGLDVSATEAQLGDKMEAMRKKAEEARERARTLAASAAPAPAPVSVPAAAPTVSAADHKLCPACNEVVQPDDVFCGNCAHKL
ncbi:hypothetical protein EDC30_111103 [Paucimonas lemoignei]|uniref:Uncharacterized protein n=1 Tax=Paucimonas lemoignei TaxID=29443 RepID=A0A4V2UIB3_PAULE|nr:hypothetical protein [Paucimonas lemoignei]TCS35188.1 hypothetical protein EDC30_111103 [Paucimonas lemoignei]